MLQRNDDHQHQSSQEQVFHGAVILRGASAAEGSHTYGNQGQTDGKHHGTGHNCREEAAQGLQHKAQNRLKKAANQGSSQNRAVRQDTAAHNACHAVEYADKAGAGTHDNRHLSAHRTDGVQLNQGYNSRHQHGVLQKRYLHLRKFRTGADSAGSCDNQNRGQISHKHGQHMLES